MLFIILVRKDRGETQNLSISLYVPKLASFFPSYLEVLQLTHSNRKLDRLLYMGEKKARKQSLSP